MKYDLTGVSVMLAMPTHRDLPVGTVISLIATADLLRSKNIPFELQLQVGGSIVETARSKIAHVFLKSDKTRLFWVDSDIDWEAEDFLRLLALSTVYPVVGASYPAKQDATTFFIDAEPTITADENGCLPVKGMGLGFTVVQRSIIEELSAKAPKLRFNAEPEPMPHIFRCDSINGEFRGEDMAFFADILELGHSIHLDPTVTLGHVGQKTYTARLLDYLTKDK